MRVLSAPLLAVCFLVACDGSHTDLAQDTSSSSAGGAGTGGSGGEGGIGGQGGSPPIVEPDGPAHLTVVNGITDRPSMQLCFLASPADAGDDAAPWPENPLDYARTALISELPGAPLPSSESVEIVVLTGDLDAAGGASCREIADDPAGFAGLEVLSIGATPVSSFTMPRSLVLVVTGCFGGVDHDGEDLDAICGEGYSPATPTPNVVIAPLSRLADPGAVSIQVVNALSSGRVLDAYVRPGFDGVAEVPVAILVAPGAVAPFPPFTGFSAAELGTISQALARFALMGQPGGNETNLTVALENGGIDAAAFSNGKNVALVGVGPFPGAPIGQWWNDFALIALEPEPSAR
ncbi:MAG: hypothetical protein HOW73_09345 [Polyangiaceae bacterium]|nr:hypothetical protein [Polyangiaceae bacterium]